MPTPVLTKTRSGYFEARWSEERRSRRKSMGSKDRAVAEARFAQWLMMGGHHAHKEEAEAARDAGFTCMELWQSYERLHVQKNVVGKETLRNNWKNLAGTFGPLKPTEISQARVDGYVDKRRSGEIGKTNKVGEPMPAKDATIRRELVTLRACLNWAADEKRKYLAKTDVPTYDLPADSEPRDRWLTAEEIEKMLDAAAAMRPGKTLTRGERFLWIALQTAARKQAILDLTWDRVDFEIRKIHFDAPGRKKTKKRRVSVAISKALMPILRRAYEERENDLVMTNKGAVWATVQSVAVKAGLATRGRKAVDGNKPLATGISPHTLRHTAATHMARRGVPLHTIAGVLGNSVAMVEKVYAKHHPGAMADAVNSIPSGKD